jgi:7 transmembrane helices usually fused to an inactive transglutaminase/Inactive transglutaminase fused to 7 transmembrane helices
MKRPAVLLAVALLLISFALIGYRIIWLKYPIFPAAPEKVWQLSMDASVESSENETTVMIGFPYTHRGQIVVEERIYSGTLSFNLLREGTNQVGVWSGAISRGGELIEYSSTIKVQPQHLLKTKPQGLGPYPKNIGEVEQELAKRLVGKWDPFPPTERLRRIAAAVKGIWRIPPPEDQDLREWSTFQEKHSQLDAILLLLRTAHLPARVVEGLQLAESVTNSTLTWIEVWTGEEWESLHPEKGEIYQKPAPLLPLTTNGLPAVRVIHGDLSEIRWTLNRQVISQWGMHFGRIMGSDRFFDRWSLFRLPAEFQGTFRILILVPIGALMICVLRNMVGFPTFGIFMPVLMALAFRNTGLLYGLGIFAGVVLIGYVVRRWINKLRLLLVPRLSLILTLVIVFFTIFALIGNKLGLRELMAVGLLPFVILTMTIERFFVIMEEAGARQGLWTAAGSAAVATITYEIIHFEPLQLTFFVYPELLLAVAAFQVLIGRYTGYRLSELIRFRKLRGTS